MLNYWLVRKFTFCDIYISFYVNYVHLFKGVLTPFENLRIIRHEGKKNEIWNGRPMAVSVLETCPLSWFYSNPHPARTVQWYDMSLTHHCNFRRMIFLLLILYEPKKAFSCIHDFVGFSIVTIETANNNACSCLENKHKHQIKKKKKKKKTR